MAVTNRSRENKANDASLLHPRDCQIAGSTREPEGYVIGDLGDSPPPARESAVPVPIRTWAKEGATPLCVCL